MADVGGNGLSRGCRANRWRSGAGDIEHLGFGFPQIDAVFVAQAAAAGGVCSAAASESMDGDALMRSTSLRDASSVA